MLARYRHGDTLRRVVPAMLRQACKRYATLATTHHTRYTYTR
jgi:hypothetical protein